VIEDIDCMTDIIQQRTKKNDKVTEEQKMPTIVINTGMPCDRGMSCDKDDKKSGKLTLSGLLNALDGVFDKDKRILIMTTNHSEILDDALIRPGRIDRNFLFDNCDKDQVKKLYEMFFEKECNKTLIERIDDKKYSPATLVGLFLRHIDKPDKSFDELS
jgi:SpoVK/Ycf46/Vps4 family AAA+-type ATPase